jgi:hypothetical protein
VLSDGMPHDRLGSHGSGIEYSGKGNRYFMTSDRGPADGGAAFKTRFHEVEIAVDPTASPPVRAQVVRTVLYKDEAGQCLVGAKTAFSTDPAKPGLRFDPEAIRLSPSGTLYVSDEYGPCIAEFGLDGVRKRVFKVPARFGVAIPAAEPAEELAKNKQGRVPNRGFEGLALTPDGKTLVALLQSPLIQDHGRDGHDVRMLVLDLASQATHEHVVRLDSAAHGFNELIAIDSRTFLALEEDAKSGKEAAFKRVMRLDLGAPGSGSEATDVSSIEALPKHDLPRGVRAVAKSVFLDLLDPAFGLAGASMPHKIEGLAFGPSLADGRRILLVTSDNDMIASQPTWIWAFAVRKEALVTP